MYTLFKYIVIKFQFSLNLATLRILKRVHLEVKISSNSGNSYELQLATTSEIVLRVTSQSKFVVILNEFIIYLYNQSELVRYNKLLHTLRDISTLPLHPLSPSDDRITFLKEYIYIFHQK